jgi:hypothetical protein
MRGACEFLSNFDRISLSLSLVLSVCAALSFLSLLSSLRENPNPKSLTAVSLSRSGDFLSDLYLLSVTVTLLTTLSCLAHSELVSGFLSKKC